MQRLRRHAVEQEGALVRDAVPLVGVPRQELVEVVDDLVLGLSGQDNAVDGARDLASFALPVVVLDMPTEDGELVQVGGLV
eukprot:1026032-Rhodomonas_salina.1